MLNQGNIFDKSFVVGLPLPTLITFIKNWWLSLLSFHPACLGVATPGVLFA